MNDNTKNAPRNDDAITLADLDELRRTLGAEAKTIDGLAQDSAPAAISTVMCPSGAWDR